VISDAHPMTGQAHGPDDSRRATPTDANPEGAPSGHRSGSVSARLTVLRSTVSRAFPRTSWALAFDVVVLAFVTAFAGIAFARYWAFDSRALDLGLYFASFMNVARGVTPAFYPHVSPIVYLFVPLLDLFPAPSTLLVLQAAAVGGSGFPVYWLTLESTRRERVAFLVATVYLAGFLPMALAWFDFHLEAFLPLFLMAALYARRRSNLPGFAAGLGLALITIQTVIPLIVVLSVLLLLSARFSKLESMAARHRDRRFAMVALLQTGVWTVALLTIYQLGPAALGGWPTALANIGGTGLAGGGGTSGLSGTVSGAFVAAWANLTQAGVSKGIFVLLILGSFGFISLVGDLVELLPAAVWIVYAIFSDRASYFSFGNQYIAYVLPFVAAAATSALGRAYAGRPFLPTPLKRVAEARPFHRLRGHAGTVALCLFLVGMVAASSVASPLRSDPLGADPNGKFGPPVLTAHEALLHNVIDALPPEASLVTTNNLFPEVSTDPSAQAFPISSADIPNSSIPATYQYEVLGARYILLDYTQDWANAAIAELSLNLSGWGLAAAGEGIRLYERDLPGNSTDWVATEDVTFPPTAFHPVAAHLNRSPPSALSYPARPGAASTFLWVGPYFDNLGPGHYAVTAEVSASNPGGPYGFTLEVVYDPVVLQQQIVQLGPSLWSDTFSLVNDPSQQVVLDRISVAATPTPEIQRLTLPFSWTGPGSFELVGENPQADATIEFYGATLVNTQDPT
jgi:uncharacterized membrane protein